MNIYYVYIYICISTVIRVSTQGLLEGSTGSTLPEAPKSSARSKKGYAFGVVWLCKAPT